MHSMRTKRKALIGLAVFLSVLIPKSSASNTTQPILRYDSKSIDESRLLEAIATVENSPTTTGRKGERSPYQILPSTWRRFTSLSIRSATPEQQRNVALVILRHFKSQLLERGIEPNVFNLALAWNGGPNARRYKYSTIDYATRVTNVYYR